MVAGSAWAGALLRPTSRGQWWRLAATTVIAATAGALLLAAAAILLWRRDAVLDGAVAYVYESGLRGGTAFGAVLLVAPLLALAWQGLRVGAAQRRHRAARIVLAGASPAQVRLLAVVRSVAVGVAGGLLAGPGYLLLHGLLGRLPAEGARWVPALGPSGLGWWALLVLGLGAAGGVAGLSEGRGPSRRRGSVAGLVARSARRGDAVAVLAAARLGADPGPATRASAVLGLCGLSIAVQGQLVLSTVPLEFGDFYLTGILAATTVTVLGALAAVASVLVAAVDQVLGAPRPVAVVAALGADPRLARAVLRRQLLLTTVPAAAVGAALPAAVVAVREVVDIAARWLTSPPSATIPAVPGEQASALIGLPSTELTRLLGLLGAIPLATAVAFLLVLGAVGLARPALAAAASVDHLRAT